MASLMAIRGATFISSFKVRSIRYSHSIFIRKTLSTSTAPNSFDSPPNHQSNPNQWDLQHNHHQGNPNQWDNRNQGFQNPQNYPTNSQQQNNYQRQNYPQGAGQQNYYQQNPNQRQNYPPPQAPIQRQNFQQHQSSNYSPQNPIPTHAPAVKADLLSICKEGKLKEAIELVENGELADAECFSALFGLCGKSRKLEDAKKVHDYFLRSSYRGDIQLNHKVIDMYSKCGSMVDARRVFDHMPDRNMDTWHLIINGYAGNGLGDDGLEMFEQMRNLGLQPNEETFLAVLESCAGADAIEEGFIHFEAMQKEYKIVPKIEHYLGLLSVLGNLDTCPKLWNISKNFHLNQHQKSGKL